MRWLTVPNCFGKSLTFRVQDRHKETSKSKILTVPQDCDNADKLGFFGKEIAYLVGVVERA